MTIADQTRALADQIEAVELGVYPSADPILLGADMHALADQVAALPPVQAPPPPPPPPPPGSFPWPGVPALGFAADCSTNTIQSIDPGNKLSSDGSNQVSVGCRNIFTAWSGIAWLKWCNRGIGNGGGHADGSSVPVVQFDLETKLWSIVKDRPDWYVKDGVTNGYVADEVTGWMYGDAAGTQANLQVGEPFNAHFYAHQVGLPPDALPGGNSIGWLYTPGRGTMPVAGLKQTKQAHALRIGDQKWQAVGPPLPYASSHGPAHYDSLRNRVWYYSNTNSRTKYFHDLTTGVGGTYLLDAPGFYSYYCMSGYMEADDLHTAIAITDTLIRFICHDSAGKVYALTHDPNPSTSWYEGTPPPFVVTPQRRHYAARWCEAWRSWVLYAGDGRGEIWFLTAPADPRAPGAKWRWSVQAIQGTIWPNQSGQGNHPYNRIAMVESVIGDTGLCLWFPAWDQPAQWFHLAKP